MLGSDDVKFGAALFGGRKRGEWSGSEEEE